MIMNLDNLSENDILHKPVPFKQLLENSVYYPFSWSDGRPIKLANTLFRRQFHEVNSFVYCDFFMDEQKCMQEMDTLCGYHPIAIRKLTPCEYLVKDFKVELSSNDEDHYLQLVVEMMTVITPNSLPFGVYLSATRQRIPSMVPRGCQYYTSGGATMKPWLCFSSSI